MQNFSQIGEVPWPRHFNITRILQSTTLKYCTCSTCLLIYAKGVVITYAKGVIIMATLQQNKQLAK